MSSPINPNKSFSQDVQLLAKAHNKKENGPMGQHVSELAHEKKMAEVQGSSSATNKQLLNVSIMESSLNYSKTIGDQPMSLLFKTALEGINEALKEQGVEKTAEETYESGVDFSPEATAERIVSFSTGFLASYREQHAEMNEEESLNTFVELIRGGIEQGFTEAKDILKSLNVLEDDIAMNIDKTYGLVQEGLQSFVDSFSKTDEE